jgi:hypothetical protein
MNTSLSFMPLVQNGVVIDDVGQKRQRVRGTDARTGSVSVWVWCGKCLPYLLDAFYRTHVYMYSRLYSSKMPAISVCSNHPQPIDPHHLSGSDGSWSKIGFLAREHGLFPLKVRVDCQLGPTPKSNCGVVQRKARRWNAKSTRSSVNQSLASRKLE